VNIGAQIQDLGLRLLSVLLFYLCHCLHPKLINHWVWFRCLRTGRMKPLGPVQQMKKWFLSVLIAGPEDCASFVRRNGSECINVQQRYNCTMYTSCGSCCRGILSWSQAVMWKKLMFRLTCCFLKRLQLLGLLWVHHPKTLKFLGSIQGNEVIILVDSGSSNSFINSRLASVLVGISQLSSPVKVQVANGQIIQCVSEFQSATWSI
jgi:hypothetical protein